MNRLFISHSTQDLEDLQPFIEFLQLGMGIAKDDIFWTSSGSVLPTGEPFVERIRSALCDCQQVLCFLTPNYFKSKFCLAEMGAAWLQKGKILPLLVSPLDYASLTGTPLQGLQALKREERDDLLRLYDELSMAGIAAVGQTAALSRQLDKYLEQISRQGTRLIPKDADGYYQGRVEAVRSVPYDYRCYKLSGLVQLEDPPVPGETHWIFFRSGMYEDLHVGDTVRFSVSYSQLRSFPDLKNARNLYPGELQRLN